MLSSLTNENYKKVNSSCGPYRGANLLTFEYKTELPSDAACWLARFWFSILTLTNEAQSLQALPSLASQETPRVLCKPTAHYVFRSAGVYPSPDWQSSCQRLSILLKIICNVILPSTPRSSEWHLSSRFFHQNPACIFLPAHTCHTSRPSHPF